MATKPQAVNQQKDNNLNVQTVLIGKLTASFLVPDYNDGQVLAVIDEGVLKYLKSLLDYASADEIIDGFVHGLEVARLWKGSNKEKLALAVKCCKDFVAFHEGVNLMDKYFNPITVVTREEPFNVEKPTPTVEEMFMEWAKMGDDLKAKVGKHGEGYETLKQFELFMMNSHTSTISTEAQVAQVVENLNKEQQ